MLEDSFCSHPVDHFQLLGTSLKAAQRRLVGANHEGYQQLL